MDKTNIKSTSRKTCGAPLGNKNAEKWTEEKALQLGNELIQWLSQESNNLTKDKNFFVGEFLSKVKGLDKSTLNYLDGKFPLFSELKKRAAEIQKWKLLNGGLTGKLNPTLVIFVMKVIHGMVETTRMEHTGGTTLTIDPKYLPDLDDNKNE